MRALLGGEVIHTGIVHIVVMYRQMFRKSLGGGFKVNYRYIPREVGELLVWFMWLELLFW